MLFNTLITLAGAYCCCYLWTVPLHLLKAGIPHFTAGVFWNLPTARWKLRAMVRGKLLLSRVWIFKQKKQFRNLWWFFIQLFKSIYEILWIIIDLISQTQLKQYNIPWIHLRLHWSICSFRLQYSNSQFSCLI